MKASAPTRAAPTPPADGARPPPAPGAREAALLLHSLPELDREWLLGELPDADRAALRPLVGELAALGIQPDPELIEDCLRARRARSGTPDAAIATTRLDLLSRADPARVAAVLEGEPAALVAELLRAHEWPWRADLVERLDPAQRAAVEALDDRRSGSGPGDGAALRGAVVEAVLRRLAEARPPARAASPRWSPPWRRKVRA